MAITPNQCFFRHLRCITIPHLRKLPSTSSSSFSSVSCSLAPEDLEHTHTHSDPHSPAAGNNNNKKPTSYFPKRGQTLELVCESLAFKGKGLCKVAETGFVVMCDRALPGERFIGRVTRKKGNYAEVSLASFSKQM